MENSENINLVCNDCMKKKKREFQKSLNKSKIKEGVLIKKKFFNQRHSEHMWVKIKKIENNGLLIGELVNEPLFLNELKFGDKVKVRLKEIEDFQA